MRFFRVNFLNAGGILAGGSYDPCSNFRQFFDYLIFVYLSLSYATLLLIVFFACGVNKLNYIKNDFVYIINQIYQYGFFPGWLHTI